MGAEEGDDGSGRDGVEEEEERASGFAHKGVCPAQEECRTRSKTVVV